MEIRGTLWTKATPPPPGIQNVLVLFVVRCLLDLCLVIHIFPHSIVIFYSGFENRLQKLGMIQDKMPNYYIFT